MLLAAHASEPRPLPALPWAVGDVVMADDPCQAASWSVAEASPANHYYRARYYDPKAGRFISEDPIGFAGGMNFYGYVDATPTTSRDPLGLAELRTDMVAGTTTFDPLPEAPWLLPITIDTRNAVSRKSLPGADDPFVTDDVAPRRIGDTKEYGANGAYVDTFDPRGRDIHGGGSGLSDPLAPRQGWVPTKGCTRGQNEDVIALAERIRAFKKSFPGVKIPYRRVREYKPGHGMPPWRQ